MIVPNIYVWLDQNSYICDLETSISTSHHFISKEEAAISRCDCGDPLSSGAACARRGSQAPICMKLPELCMREYAILFTPAENRLLQPITTTVKTTTHPPTTTPTTTTTTRRTTKAAVPFQQRQQQTPASRRQQFGSREGFNQRRPFPPNSRQNRPFFTLAPRFPQNFQQRPQGQRRGTIEQDFLNFRNVNPRLRNGRLRTFTTVVPTIPQQRRNLPFRPQQQSSRQNRPRPPPLPTQHPVTSAPATTTTFSTTTTEATTTSTTPTPTTSTTPSTTSSTTTATTTTEPSTTTTMSTTTQVPLTVGSQTVDQLMQLLIARLLAATNSKNGDPAAALMSLMEKNGIEVPKEMKEEVENNTPRALPESADIQKEVPSMPPKEDLPKSTATSPVEVPSEKPQEKVAMFSDVDDGSLHQRVVFSTQMDIGEHNMTPRVVTSPAPQVTSPSTTTTTATSKSPKVVPSATSSHRLGKLPIQHRLDSDVTKPKKVLEIVTSPSTEVTTTKGELVASEAPEKQLVTSRTIFVNKKPEEKVTVTPSEKPMTSPGTIWASSRQSPVMSSVQQLMAVQQPVTKKKLSPGTIWMRNFIEENLRSLWNPTHEKPVTGQIEDSKINNFIEQVEAPVTAGKKASLQKTAVTQPSKTDGKGALAPVVTSSEKPSTKRNTVVQVTSSEKPTIADEIGVEEIPLGPAPKRTTLKPVKLRAASEEIKKSSTLTLELTTQKATTSSKRPQAEESLQKSVKPVEATTTAKTSTSAEPKWIERSRVNKTQPSHIEVVRLIPELKVTSVVQRKPETQPWNTVEPEREITAEEAEALDRAENLIPVTSSEKPRRPVTSQQRPPTARPRIPEEHSEEADEDGFAGDLAEEQEETSSSPSKISVSTESQLTLGREGFSSVSLIQQKLDKLETQLMGVLTDKLSDLDDFNNFERNDINPFPPRRRTNHRQRQPSEDGFSLDSGHTTMDKDEPQQVPKMQEVLDMNGMKFKTSPFNPKVCEDNHPLCEYWAFYKQCRMNAPYMYKFCRKACKICE